MDYDNIPRGASTTASRANNCSDWGRERLGEGHVVLPQGIHLGLVIDFRGPVPEGKLISPAQDVGGEHTLAVGPTGTSGHSSEVDVTADRCLLPEPILRNQRLATGRHPPGAPVTCGSGLDLGRTSLHLPRCRSGGLCEECTATRVD